MNIPIQFSSVEYKRRLKKKLWPRIVIYSVLIIILAVNAFGFYMGNKFYKLIFEADTNKNVDFFAESKYSFNEKRYNSLQKEDVSVGSKNNYRLYGTYIKNPAQTKNTIILLHSLGSSRWSTLKYIDLYLDKGFNILIYDSRDHGHSGGKNITYGFSEKIDLDRWVSWVASKNSGGIIGVHGEFLGASTALLQADPTINKNKVSFYIADSPYSDLNQLLTLKLTKDYKIKNIVSLKFIMFYLQNVNKVNNKFTFKEASPINYIKDVTTPVLFIHGEKDSVVPEAMSQALYDEKPSAKDLYIVPNAEHLDTYSANQDEYKNKIYNFLDNYVLKK